MIEIDTRLYDALLILLMTASFVATYEFISRKIFKRVVYSLEYTLVVMILSILIIWLLSMCFVDLLFNIPSKNIMRLTSEDIMKHVLVFTAISAGSGIVLAIARNKAEEEL